MSKKDIYQFINEKTGKITPVGKVLRTLIAEFGFEVTPDELELALQEAIERTGFGTCIRCRMEDKELRWGVCFDCMMKEPEPDE